MLELLGLDLTIDFTLSKVAYERAGLAGQTCRLLLKRMDPLRDTLRVVAFLRLLLPAGAETTYRSSSNLIFGLLTHTDQLDAVRRDRTLIPQAIEEGLRWEPPLIGILRGVTRGGAAHAP